MVDFTPRNSFRIPELTDQARITDAVGQFAADADKRAFSIYATPAARDLANPTPESGSVCFVQSYNLPMVYYTSYWGFWPGTPVALLYQTVAQTIGSGGVGNGITFDAEVFDTLSGHSTVTNTTRYQPSVPGRYRFDGSISWAANASGTIRSTRFIKNSSTEVIGPQGSIISINAGNVPNIPAFAFIDLNGSSDYVQMFGFHDNGSTLATYVAAVNFQPTMAVTYMGPAS